MNQQIILNLTKKLELNLTKAGVTNIPVLEVKLAVDRSGSMASLFRGGFVDSAINLFLPLALKFDDNQLIEVGFFNDSFSPAPFATIDDVGSYLRKSGQYAGGGTRFQPIIDAFETCCTESVVETTPAPGFFARLFGKVEVITTSQVVRDQRAYAAIITDGDASDRSAFERSLAATSGDTFFQLIAIGSGVNLSYLSQVADQYPHVHLFHIPDPLAIDEDQFYEHIVNDKFKAWM